MCQERSYLLCQFTEIIWFYDIYLSAMQCLYKVFSLIVVEGADEYIIMAHS